MAVGPKYPVTVFAEWPAGELLYMEDADGKIWAQSPRGFDRMSGSRFEVSQKIGGRAAGLRGDLIKPYKKNPRKRSKSLPAMRRRLSDVDFNQKAYRGYLIRKNSLTGDMWIEKDGHLIGRVPASQSWAWAQKEIDALLDPTPNPKRRKIDSVQAREILARHNALNVDFHSLRSSDVQGLLDEAKRLKYRASASAPGSRARMFHQHLTRLAAKIRMNPKRRTRTILGIDARRAARIMRKSARKLTRIGRTADARTIAKKARRLKNPVRYKITAQNKGKKMHFDGRNFSERPTVKSFAFAEDAKQTALALIRRYPILRKYRVHVESFP